MLGAAFAAPVARRRVARPVEAQRPEAEPVARLIDELVCLDLALLTAGGFGTEVGEETTRELAEMGSRPARRLRFDLSHLPRERRAVPNGLMYSFGTDEGESCLYGREDPRSTALATAAGQHFWEPRLRGRSVRDTFDGAGGGGDEAYGALQCYLEEARISTALRRLLIALLRPEQRADDRFAALRQPGLPANTPLPERTIAVLGGLCGTAGRTLLPVLPYLLRDAARAIWSEQPELPRCRLRIIGFAFGPRAFSGLHPDALWNYLSALDDFEQAEQRGFRGVFATRTIESQAIGYNELYLLDGSGPEAPAARLSDQQLHDFAVEAAAAVALRLTAPLDAELRELLDNPEAEGHGQGGFLRTLRARGVNCSAPIVRGLLGVAQAHQLLDQLERRVSLDTSVA